MLRFFRRLRRQIVEEGKLQKYLLYAAGEILLIVIGVLLAIQVNAMREKRVERKDELTIYRTVKDQLLSYRDILADDAGFNEYYRVRFAYANEIIASNDRGRIDTLGKIVREMINYSDFDGIGNIHETLVNSGEVKLLTNPGIVESIRRLEEGFLHVNRIENIHYDAVLNFVIPSVKAEVAFATGAVQHPDALYRTDFQNLLLLLLRVMEEKAEAYQSTMAAIDRVTGLIDEELQRDRK
jgi:hypothetical protein